MYIITYVSNNPEKTKPTESTLEIGFQNCCEVTLIASRKASKFYISHNLELHIVLGQLLKSVVRVYTVIGLILF